MADDRVRRRLGDLVVVKHGFAFQGEYFCDEPTGMVLVTPGNFEIGGGFKSDKPKHYNGPVPEGFLLEAGDLVVTMTDLSKGGDTLGYPAVIPRSPGVRHLHNQRIGRVEILDPRELDKGYLYYLLCSEPYRHEVLASATGSTVRHTSPSRIGAFEFCAPRLSEQRAIAGVLGALDEKIGLNRRMNETLEAMGRALFRSWFVDFDPVAARAEGRAPAAMDSTMADLFPNAFEESELGKVPRGWGNAPVLEWADLISGGTPKTSVSEYWGGSIRWASAKDVSRCGSFLLLETERTITQAGVENSSAKVLPADCVVVVARGATCGRFTVLAEPMAINQTCYALHAKRAESRWYLRFLAEGVLQRLVVQAHGSVFDTITTSTFELARAVLPPPEVMDAFEKTVGPLIERIRVGQRESVTLAALRVALLPRLLSGELRVRDAERMVERAV